MGGASCLSLMGKVRGDGLIRLCPEIGMAVLGWEVMSANVLLVLGARKSRVASGLLPL